MRQCILCAAALLGVAFCTRAMAISTSLTAQSTTGVAGITSWPNPFNDATTTNPSTFTVAEGTYTGNGVQPQPPATPGPSNSLAQSWTSTASGPLGHVQIAVTGTPPVNFDVYLWQVTGGNATDNGGLTYGTVPPGGTNVSVQLLATSDADLDPNNLVTSDSLTFPLYTLQGANAAVLDFDFTTHNIAIASGTQYIFEISSDTSLSSMQWFRSAANGLTGQAFRNRGSLNGNNARDMSMAVSIVPEPAALSLCAVAAMGLVSRRRRA
jgi:hypothetical protein